MSKAQKVGLVLVTAGLALSNTSNTESFRASLNVVVPEHSIKQWSRKYFFLRAGLWPVIHVVFRDT